jgi:hypothetical protein
LNGCFADIECRVSGSSMDRSGSNPGNDYAIAASLPLRSSLSATVTHCPAGGLKRATTREEIAARRAEWEITGLAKVRSPIGGGFNQYRVVPHRDETVAETDEQREPAP